MSKYLKLFETTAQYNAYTADTSNFILPNVSVCEDAPSKVYYHPYVDPYNGHEYVDLGLPSGTKWAKMNVGAISESDYGNYYKYGKGATQFEIGDYAYSGNENPLPLSRDTAAQVMGGQWHTPTKVQFQELTANTYYREITIDNVKCYKFIKYDDDSKYVLFPTNGCYLNSGEQRHVGLVMYYWASTPYNSQYAWSFNSINNNIGITGEIRDNGFGIRGVVG